MNQTKTVVGFYDKGAPYYQFSNFYPETFTDPLTGKVWSTSEHYFQAQKYCHPGSTPADLAYAELIRSANTPNKSFILARQKKKGGYASKWSMNPQNPMTLNAAIEQSIKDGVKMRPDWELIKEDVMRRALFLKFTQNPALQKLLMSTGTATIEEQSPRDWYWGTGKDGTGKNRLGALLQDLRKDLLDSGSKSC